MYVTPTSLCVVVYVEFYCGFPYVNYLHFIWLVPTCHFSGHNVSLLMSLCCIILVAPHISVTSVTKYFYFVSLLE